MFSMYVIIVLIFMPVSQCANILGIMPAPSYSHQIVYRPLWKELSLRGHKVTVITTDPINDPKLVNLTEIDIHFAYKYVANISKLLENTLTMWNMQEVMADMCLLLEEQILEFPPVRKLIHKNNNTFDVVLVEFVVPELLAFGKIFDCPTILISSLDVTPEIHSALGNPAHSSLYPSLGTSFYAPLTFKERLINTIYTWYTSYTAAYVVHPKEEKLLKKYFNNTITINELIRDLDLLFLNVNPAIQTVRAVGPTTINIGGYRETLLEPLPKELQDFLDTATDGFVYFSLGSNLKSQELAGPTFTAIFEALKEIPYKVLWKYEGNDLPGKPDNIQIVKWAPQEKVLSHPNIKVFVTQGGLQSMEEGIYREVPFVVIPFAGDQEHNSRLMESKGIAVRVQRMPTINKEELKKSILEVINNPRYKNSVKKLKQQALDMPMSGIESAVWWTEYVIRHKGAKHLRNPSADLPFYQYYLLDVICFLVLVATLVFLVTVIIVKSVCKLISYTKLVTKGKKKTQ